VLNDAEVQRHYAQREIEASFCPFRASSEVRAGLDCFFPVQPSFERMVVVLRWREQCPAVGCGQDIFSKLCTLFDEVMRERARLRRTSRH
jgi:hypothetical protein